MPALASMTSSHNIWSSGSTRTYRRVSRLGFATASASCTPSRADIGNTIQQLLHERRLGDRPRARFRRFEYNSITAILQARSLSWCGTTHGTTAHSRLALKSWSLPPDLQTTCIDTLVRLGVPQCDVSRLVERMPKGIDGNYDIYEHLTEKCT